MQLFTLDSNQSFVQDVAQFGSDELIYKVTRVCTGHGFDSVPYDFDALERFIYNLLKKNHMRCFEFTGIVFGIRCPIFVERQLRTYRKPELERSLRFTEPIESANLEPESNGSENPVGNWKKLSVQKYRNLRESGWKKEEARRVLPLDTLTEVVSYYTLRSLFHVFEERLQPPAQSETSQIVNLMYEIASQMFPATFKAYERVRSEALESTK